MSISLDIIQKITDFFNSSMMDWLKNFLAIIPKIMYFIVSCILSLVDLFQVLFRKLAGLDPIMISNEVTTGDSVYELLMDALFTGKYPAINTAFWAIVILGIFMLIVTSIVATIRLEYNPDKEKGNSKSAIVKNFFKSLFNFAIIPIACLFGMALCNSLVGIIDQVTAVEIEQTDSVYTYFDQWQGVGGTSEDNILTETKTSYIAYDIFGISIPTTAEPFSGIMFKASAHSANRFRLYGQNYLAEVTASGTDLGIFSTGQIGDYRTAADIIDTGFAVNAKLKGGSYSLSYDGITEYSASLQLFGSKTNITSFSKYNVEMVWYFYDLWSFNWIVAFCAVIIVGKLYFQFCLMLMARIFEIAGLFLIAPIPIAIMPMDGGGALGRWRGTFIGKFGLIAIMVLGLNLVSPVLSIMQQIKLFNLALLDNICLAMFLVAAMNAINSLNNTISTIIFDKASQYKDSMELSEKAVGSLQSGVQATMAAGKVGAALPLLAARTGATLASKGIRAGANRFNQSRLDRIENSRNTELSDLSRRHTADMDRLHSDEISEIRSQIDYDETTGLANFKTMSADDRRDMADDFLSTAAGQEFANRYYGGNIAEAKKRIAEDQKPGVRTSNYLDDAARKEIAQFAHDRAQFARTKEAGGLTEGTAAYRQALEKYASGSADDKAEYFVGGAPLTARQQAIQASRATAESDYSRDTSRINSEHDARKEKVGRTGRFISEKINPRIAKANEFIKPHINSTKTGLQSIINIIPGVELFGKPKK